MDEPAAEDSPAEMVRRVRSELGITQEELARRLGVSFVSVNRWEAGRSRPRAGVLEQLSRLETERPAPTPTPTPTAAAEHSAGSFATPFIGRAEELDELARRVPGRRLTTITGPSGIGKSRLARALADRLGCSFVDAPGRLPDEVGDGPLVIDFEGSATADARRLVAELHDGTPARAVVAVTRIPLGLADELIRPLGPLTPDDGMKLLIELISQSRGQFSPSAEEEVQLRLIAGAGGGVPLAIEALASWAATVSLEEIAGREAELLTAPAAQMSTLAEACARSVAHLSDADRGSLAETSVFAGPFTLVDAEAVLTVERDEVAGTIARLSQSGWLHADPDHGTYLLPRPWRGSLAGAERDASRRRHGIHFLELARANGLELNVAASMAARSRLEAAEADIGDALLWARIDQETTLKALGACANLSGWFLSSGRIGLGRSWIEPLLKEARSVPDDVRVYAFATAAMLAAESADHEAAILYATNSGRSAKALGFLDPQALAETILGAAHRQLGHLAEGRRHLENALKLREEGGNARAISSALNNLSLMANDDGDHEVARRLLERALALKRDFGDERGIALGLTNLAASLIALRLPDDALARLTEAEEIANRLDDPMLRATVDCNVGDAHLVKHSFEQARRDFERGILGYRNGGQEHQVIVAMCGLARALIGLERNEEALATVRSAEELVAATGSEQPMSEIRMTLATIGRKASNPLPDGLTERQAEILGCVADGSSNAEIAKRLHLSPGTVERHLATIYQKLGLKNRVQAARYALSRGLLPPDQPA